MVTRQQSTKNTPLHTPADVSRAGETPGWIRATRCIAVCRLALGHLRRAADGLQLEHVNINNRCKQRELQRIYCS